MRFILKLVIYVIVLAALLGVGLYFLPKEYYKKGLAWVMYTQAGIELDIRGDIKVSPVGATFLVLDDVVLQKRLDDTTRVTLTFAEARFNRSGILVSDIALRDASVVYKDMLKDVTDEYKPVNLTIVPPQGLSDTLKIKGDVGVKGERVDLDITIDDFERFQKGKVSDAVAKVATRFMTVDYNGTATNKGPNSGDVKLDVSAIESLLSWLKSDAKITGKLYLDSNFRMDNNDLGTLSGSGNLKLSQVTQGYVDPVWQRLISYVAVSSNLELTELTSSFTINRGVVHTEDMRGVGPVTSFEGKGDLDLVQKALNFRVVPQANINVRNLPSIKPPFTIKGPLNALEVSVEAKEILKEVIKNPEQVIKSVTDVIKNNADGKALKKDLQDIRKNILSDTELQQQLLQGILGGGAQSSSGGSPASGAPAQAPPQQQLIPGVPLQIPGLLPPPSQPMPAPGAQ